MALHAYSISDGTTTFSLTSGTTCVSTGYVPSAPEIEAQERVTTQDGGEVDLPRYKNVTETMELLIIGASDSAVKTNVHTLEQLLDAAKRRQRRKVEPKVYLQVQIDTDASAWRSEILNARLEMKEDGLAVYGNYKIPYLLHITRRYFFEGPRTELSISSNGNSASTGGRAITNSANNWIQIAAAQVGGSVPTPLELSVTNTSGGTRSYRNFYIGTNAFSDPANFSHNIGSGTVTLSLSSGLYTGQIPYTLSSTVMQDTQGRSFRLLARITALGGSMYVIPRIRDSAGLSILAEGDETYINSTSWGTQWYDLGALPLPPGGYFDTWTGTTLTFDCRGSSTHTITLGTLQLTPIDSYQYIVQRGLTIPNNTLMTFDNIEGIYHVGGAPIYSPRSGPLMVWPNTLQRVIILYDEGSSSTTTHTASVRAYVRERRLTI